MMIRIRRFDLLVTIYSIIAASLIHLNASAQVTVSNQELLGKPLAAIEITGNEITVEGIILRELKLAIGDAVTMDALELDQLRVSGLDLFSRVQFNLVSRDGLPVLKIEVTEEWYIFPLPSWNYSDDDPPKITYGFRYRQKNFRGRNETLTASLWSGTDRGFMFSHDTPWVKRTPGLTRRVELYQITKKSENLAVRDLNLECHHTGADLVMGKRWRREFVTELGVRFRLVQADDPRQLAGKGNLDRMVEAFIVAAWDGRDLRQLPRRGFYLGTSLTQGYILSSSQQYQRFLIDIRTYIPYHFLSYCFRVRWLPGWGTVPPYDYIIVENTVPIRSSNLLDEGESLLTASFETRFDLYPLHYFTWQKAPLLKQYFRDLQYGLAAEIFIDVGDVYSSEGAPSVNTLMWGYGAGLLFRIPYFDVLRLECSWNPECSFEDVRFSWKLGVSF